MTSQLSRLSIFVLFVVLLVNLNNCQSHGKIERLERQLKMYKRIQSLDTKMLELTIWLKDACLTGRKTSLDNAEQLNRLAKRELDNVIKDFAHDKIMLAKLRHLDKRRIEYFAMGLKTANIYKNKGRSKGFEASQRLDILSFKLYAELNTVIVIIEKNIDKSFQSFLPK